MTQCSGGGSRGGQPRASGLKKSKGESPHRPSPRRGRMPSECRQIPSMPSPAQHSPNERRQAGACGTSSSTAARFAAMGPMSHAAVELLTRHDVRGVDVDVPALLRAGDEGGAVGLLADPATARWFSRYLVRDLHAMVKV